MVGRVSGQVFELVFDGVEVLQGPWGVADDADVEVGIRPRAPGCPRAEQDDLAAAQAVDVVVHDVGDHGLDFGCAGHLFNSKA